MLYKFFFYICIFPRIFT